MEWLIDSAIDWLIDSAILREFFNSYAWNGSYVSTMSVITEYCVSFFTLYGGQFTFSTQLWTLNYLHLFGVI